MMNGYGYGNSIVMEQYYFLLVILSEFINNCGSNLSQPA